MGSTVTVDMLSTCPRMLLLHSPPQKPHLNCQTPAFASLPSLIHFFTHHIPHGLSRTSHAAPAAPHHPLCTPLRIHRIRTHARPHNAVHSPSNSVILAARMYAIQNSTCQIVGWKPQATDPINSFSTVYS